MVTNLPQFVPVFFHMCLAEQVQGRFSENFATQNVLCDLRHKLQVALLQCPAYNITDSHYNMGWR